MKKIRTILEHLSRILIILLVSFFIGLNLYYWNASVVLGNSMPMPFGYGVAIILSGSMEPKLSIDDMIIVKEQKDYQVGDVVVFQKDYNLVVHRIIEMNDSEIITKGDANNIEDSPITKDNIKGEVVNVIPNVGKLVNFVKSPLGILLFFSISGYLYYLTNKIEKKHKDAEIEKLKNKLNELKNKK